MTDTLNHPDIDAADLHTLLRQSMQQPFPTAQVIVYGGPDCKDTVWTAGFNNDLGFGLVMVPGSGNLQPQEGETPMQHIQRVTEDPQSERPVVLAFPLGLDALSGHISALQAGMMGYLERNGAQPQEAENTEVMDAHRERLQFRRWVRALLRAVAAGHTGSVLAALTELRMLARISYENFPSRTAENAAQNTKSVTPEGILRRLVDLKDAKDNGTIDPDKYKEEKELAWQNARAYLTAAGQ